MKGYLLLTILCLSLTMPGCAWFRETALEGIDEYVETVETEKEATRKLLGVWLYRSCQLKAALGARRDSLPGDALKAWDKLDELAKKDKLTDCELGTASGCWILGTYEVVRKAVELIAPDVIGLLPAFL